ncbi:MAG: hypothetical protein V3S40_13315 [Kiloniellales bacterium]
MNSLFRFSGRAGAFGVLALGPAILALFLAPGPGLADAPLAAPALKTVCSPNGVYCAVMDPNTSLTRVHRAGRANETLWSMTGWFRVAALSDDGKHLVTGYDGMNLLPLDYAPDTVVLTFHKRGEVIRRVKLSDVVGDLAKLQPTVSQLYWGHYVGFNETGRYVIETVEGRRLAFDVATGQLVDTR